MMRKKLKQHKAAAVAAAVTLCITGAAGTMAVYGQNAAEKQVKEAAEEKLSRMRRCPTCPGMKTHCTKRWWKIRIL